MREDKVKEDDFNDKIDYTFLYRQKVGELLDQLVDNKKNYKKRDNIIKKIFGLERHAIPVILERFQKANSKEASILSQLLMLLEVENENIGEKLIRLAFDSTIPDRNKNYILKVLEFYGLEPGELPQEEVFNDPDKAIKDAREALFTEITQNIEAIPQFLLETSEFSPEIQYSLIQEMAKEGDEKTVILLKVLALSDEPGIAREAIRGLEENSTSSGLAVLEELLLEEDREPYYEMIEDAKNNLYEKGILYPEKKQKKGFKTDEIYQAAVSKIDGRGNRAIWLALRWGKDKGGVCLINFLCNIDDGLKDCWGIYRITISEFKKLISDFRRDNSIISNDPEYAQKILSDAIYKSHENGSRKPVEFAFWRNFLEKDWLKKEPYLTGPVDFSQLSSDEKKKRTENLWNELKQLHEHRDFWDWFVHHPHVYELASELLYSSKKSNKLIVLSTSKDMQKVYSNFIDNLIKPKLDFYTRSLRLMADFELKKGRTKMYRVIMYAIYYLQEKGEVDNHPFIKGMVHKSLQMAAQNIKHGFDLRINPEDFDI